MLSKCFFVLCLLVICEADFQEKNCEVDGSQGKCMDLRDCHSAVKDLKLLKIRPKICYFNQTSREPIVCCPDSPRPGFKQVSFNTEIVIPYEKIFGDDVIEDFFAAEECPPLKEEYVPVTKEIAQGHKAWAKCVEYQKTAVFPCSKTNSSVRLDYCHSHNATGHVKLLLGGGGVDAEVGEFPHMALLGYGSSHEEAQWLCGGSLISERFILTAAHCTATAASEKIAFAAFGVLERSSPLEEWDIYGIKTIISHPDYKAPIKYHDIALLETDKNVQFSDIIYPACLHVGDEIKMTRASATGWGTLGYQFEEQSDTLQNVPLWTVKDDKCSRHFFPHRTLQRGYDNVTQMCYGDDGIARDTCRGDSGGPLQVMSTDIYCSYVIIGVTSFGNVKCASVGYPGIYTRVAHYIPWIESIVWP